MKFLLSVIDGGSNTATAGEIEHIDAFNDKLQANGHWIYANGIEGPEHSVVIDNRSGLGQVTPGPLVQHPEHISGFWLIDAPSREVAEQLAHEGSLACNRKVEVRTLHGN